MKTKKEILDSYSNDMKGLLEFGNYSCVAVPYENALKAMEAYASERIKELLPSDEEIEKWAEYCAENSVSDHDQRVIIKAALILGFTWFKSRLTDK